MLKSARQHAGRLWIVVIAGAAIHGCRGDVNDPGDLTTASVTISPSQETLELPSGSIQLTATARNQAGEELSGRLFTWSSSAPEVAGVTQSGLVSAILEGEVTITASTDGRSGTAAISIVPARVASIQIAPASPSILIGESVTLSAVLRDEAGNVLTGRAVSWTTDDANIASVTPAGVVTGESEGTTMVTAASEGRSSQTAVTVAPAPEPDDLACGTLIVASIDVAAEVDVYTFSGAAGQRVLLTNTQTTANFNALVHARATILSPTGIQLQVFDSNSQRVIVLPETGTYTVRVNASNLATTGGYALGRECLIPSPAVDAALSPGDLLASTISSAAEVDLYTFEGQSGDDVLLTMTQTTANFNALVHARATVLTPGGVQLLVFDSNAQRRQTLPETGTYVVYVNASNLFATGGYSLGFESLSPLGPTDGALGVGVVQTGTIGAPAEVDIFTFSGQAGESVLLTTAQLTGFNALVHARATVLSPSGAQLVVFDSNGQRTVQLPEDGVYVVMVNASNLFTTGTYNIGRQ